MLVLVLHPHYMLSTMRHKGGHALEELLPLKGVILVLRHTRARMMVRYKLNNLSSSKNLSIALCFTIIITTIAYL